MKIIRKTFLTLSLVFLLLANSISPIYATQPTDISDNWAKDYITQWINDGIISGYEDGTFKPNSNITRAEFVKLINKSMGFSEKGELSYKDVNQNDWFYADIQIASKAGYIIGYNKDKFAPNNPITREQATAILVRIKDLAENTDAISKFNDKEKISEWAKGLVGAAVELEYINGYTDGTFRASNSLTRAEAVNILNSVVNYKNVIISKADQEIKDIVINGKLIFTKALGESNAYVKNVEVKDGIIVNGGGANSLYFDNVTSSFLTISKLTPTRLVFRDGSKINNIETLGSAIVESAGNTVIDKIVIKTGENVVLRGIIKNVTIEKGATVVLEGAKIENMIINDDVIVEMDNVSNINLVQANDAALFSGKGTIGILQANANGIKYEVKINNIELNEGIEEPEKITAPTTGGGGGIIIPPVTQKVLAVKLEKASSTTTVNFNYEDTDTLQSLAIKNSNEIADALNSFKVNTIMINNKNILSKEVLEKVAEILEIDKSSKTYIDFINSDLKVETILSKLSLKSNVLIQHLSDNKAQIKTNIDGIDLGNINVEVNGNTKQLDEIIFSVKFGSEAEIKTIPTLIEKLLNMSDDLKDNTIDKFSFNKVVIKIESVTITIERATITK